MSGTKRSDGSDDTASTTKMASPGSPASQGGSGSAGSSSGGTSTLKPSDLAALEQSLRKTASGAMSAKLLDDGTASVMSSSAAGPKKVQYTVSGKLIDDDGVEGDEWVDVETATSVATKTVDFDSFPPPSAEADALSSWPEDKVQALAQHLRAAPWHDVRYSLQTFQHGMTGDEILTWLKSQNFAKTDEEACSIGQAMVARRMFFQLNRRSKFRGFAPTKKQQYTLEDAFTEDSRSLTSRISRAVKSAKEVAAVPFRLVKGNHMVTVIIEERERRTDPTVPYSSAFLRPGDGPALSMEKDNVPVPAVDDESPDMCDWVDDWCVEVSDQTDENGWRYSIDFKDPQKFLKGDTKNNNYLTRLREWSRHARKRIEKKSEREGGADDAAEDEPREKTEQEIEEENKKELLSKAAAEFTRVARTGNLTLHVVKGEHLEVLCDSYVEVDHGSAYTSRSEVCPRKKCHCWNYKAEVPIQSDLEGVRISVYKAAGIGRDVCLGVGHLHMEMNSTAGESAILLKRTAGGGDDAASNVALDAEDVGQLLVNWTFAPTGTTATKSSAIKRSVLRITFDKISNLTREKKRLGPCGIPIAGKSSEKVSVFLRIKYFGEYCDMECQSPLFKFAPEVNLDWKFSALLLPSCPVVVELWHSDVSAPVGQLLLHYDPTETEQLLQLDIARPRMDGAGPIVAAAPSSPTAAAAGSSTSIATLPLPLPDAAETLNADGSPLPPLNPATTLSDGGALAPGTTSSTVTTTTTTTSAAGNLGTLFMRVHWVPDLDAVDELVALGMDSTWSSGQRNLLNSWE